MSSPDPDKDNAPSQHSRERVAQAALETVAEGGPLTGVLEFLCRTMEAESVDRVIACIHPVDEDGAKFLDTVAPSLDPHYRAAINGIPVASMLGPCCHAVTTKQTIAAPDLDDPKWAGYQPYARPYGFRSAWSKPILSNDGKVLGTFAHFYFEPRDPSPHDERIVDLLARAAAVAIERSRAEAALRQLNETLEERVQAETRERLQIWNVSQDLLMVANLEGEYLSVNPAWTTSLGWSENDLLGKTSQWLVHPDDQPSTRAEIQELAKGRKTQKFENRLRARDGAYHWMMWTAAADNERIYGMGRDITEHKRAEAALRESEERFRDYAETASDWFWEIGADYTVTRLTENAFGGDATSRIGATCWDRALDFETEPEKWRAVRETLDTRRPFRDFTYLADTASGAMYVKANGQPVFDARGAFLGYRGTASDVSERVRAEQALNAARAEHAHAARVMTLGMLTASIAHEINQPLAGILTNAETSTRMLDADPPNIEGARDATRRSVRDAHRVTEVISRLRSLFKKDDELIEAIDLNESVQEIVALSSNELRLKKIAVLTELAESLPGVDGDRVQLQQVILNLLLNASDALGAVDDRPRHIVITTGCDDAGCVRLSVRDNGPGIDAQAANRLFEPFFTTKAGGMGIGLSLSRSIIERHGGQLSADASQAPGASFSIVLPAGEISLTALWISDRCSR